MFWSGDKLKEKLVDLVENAEGNTSGVDVDCAAISLTVGNEVYITPSNEKDPNVKQILDDKKPQFVIPKGQFALLLTAETLYVPTTALAFISFKAKYKFKGLINVSGFHVDPGWKGQLTFSVYNAGPTDIVLERGKPFALIWYADLDSTATAENAKKYKTPVKKLNSDKISDMTGEVFSPFKLKQEIDDLKKELLTLESKIIARYSTVIFAVFTAILGFAIKDHVIKFFDNLVN
ncbi:dCTP deaminase domain-containing protein [Pseudomonas fluorescens]|uniref:Deoxycytidine triphosphate deaminase n=1 Tax=Pseudomonas fluorescens TaxID=294 RepID=A0A5E7THG2_PSEFL|nr:deoxycytidine triphosphate deaminase [Pseudomonas fluorescens]VVP97628.1 Deoxycytidine triphosphate deaminase [Pseudomonas fluorescens]